MEVCIVNNRSCADIFIDGTYRITRTDSVDVALPLAEGDSILVYPAGGSQDRVRKLLGERHSQPLQGPAIIQTDQDVHIIRADGNALPVFNGGLWSSSVRFFQKEMEDRMGRKFFPMSGDQRAKQEAYLLAYLSQLTEIPTEVHIPVFALYIYALNNSADLDENRIQKYVSIPAHSLPDTIRQAADDILHNCGEGESYRLYLKNRVLAEHLESIRL